MESLAPAPAVAETAPVENAEADAESVVTEGGESASPAAETGNSGKVKEDPVQKRFDQLTREKYDALRERDRKDYELERLNARLRELETAKTTETAPQNDFPTLEQHGYDEAKYAAAVAAHFTKIATEQGKTAAQRALQEERERQQGEQRFKSWETKVAEFAKSKPDYADKVYRQPRDGGPVITPEMGQVIQDSEFGPQIAYYLAENVEASAAIAKLPPISQAREIGRIEARLEAQKAPPKPAVSQAPPPPSRIEADSADVVVRPDDPDSDKLSDAEWNKLRLKQLQRKRK